MLVCNVSLLRRRASIVALLAETAAALDAPGTGNVVFATLVDDPASVRERVDAYLGQIMLEAASAASIVSAGLVYAVAVVEVATAAELCSSPGVFAGAVSEAATANDSISATIVGAIIGSVSEAVSADSTQDATATFALATWDPATVTAVALSGGNLVATNTGTTSTNQGAHVASGSGKTSGKHYFEVAYTTAPLNQGNSVGVGIATTASTYANLGASATTGDISYRSSGNIWANGSNSGSSLGAASSGEVIEIAVDLDNRKIWFRRQSQTNWNGSGTANPATNVGGITIPAGTMVPFCIFGGTAGTSGQVMTANFGAAAFVGTVPSGFNSGWRA